MAEEYIHPELGAIRLQRRVGCKRISISVGRGGRIVVTRPWYVSVRAALEFVNQKTRVPCAILIYLMTLWSMYFPHFMFGNTEDRIDQPNISGDSNAVCLIPETDLSVLISYILEPD